MAISAELTLRFSTPRCAAASSKAIHFTGHEQFPLLVDAKHCPTDGEKLQDFLMATRNGASKGIRRRSHPESR